MGLQKAEDRKEEPKQKKEVIQIVDKLPVQEIRTMEGKINGEEVTLRFKTVHEFLTELANENNE